MKNISHTGPAVLILKLDKERVLEGVTTMFTLATQNCAWAVILLSVKTHSDRKHKSKQTFNFGQNAGQRGKMCPTSKLIQMHETRSPTKYESTVQAEISNGRKNSSLEH